MFRFFKRDAATVPTPPADAAWIFLDDSTGEPSYKDDTGTVTSLQGATGATGPAGGVTSVNGATGAVVLDAADLAIADAGGHFTATDVEGALQELAAGGGGGGGGASAGIAQVMLSDMVTNLTTGTAKAVWFAPEDGTLDDVWLGLYDTSSSGVVRIDMNDSGGSVFTTRPSIDATEQNSLTGTAAVLDGTVSFSRGDMFTFDIDDAGTDAKGLQVTIEYTPA